MLFNLKSVNDLHKKNIDQMLQTLTQQVSLLADRERQLITSFCAVLQQYLRSEAEYDSNGQEPCQLTLLIQTAPEKAAQKFELTGSRFVVCSKDHFNAKQAQVLLDFP